MDQKGPAFENIENTSFELGCEKPYQIGVILDSKASNSIGLGIVEVEQRLVMENV